LVVIALAIACGAGEGDDAADSGSDETVGTTQATTNASTTTSASSSSTSDGTTSAATTSDPDTTDGEGTSAGTTGGDGSGLVIDGEGFRFDGAPIFLLGISYFDGRDWQAADLDGLSQRGWNLVRVWLDWSDDGYFGPDGALSPEGNQALLELVAAARARDMVVDVTILDPELLVFPADTDHRVIAVQSVTTALTGANNVLFDVMNEHDHPSGPIEHPEGGTIAAAVKAIDPDRIVTISSTGGHLVGDDGTVQVAMVDEEIDVVGVEVVTPHLPRTPDWASVTGLRVGNLRAHLQERGAIMPIYLQEEARRGHSGLDPAAEEFVTAAQQARDAGAAGWNFHTDAGFELGPAGFFAALDEVEVVVVDTLPGML
jgi:hypothetical protein